MSNNSTKGFKVHDFIELFRFTPFVLNVSIPLEQQTNCPACQSTLEPIVGLVGNSNLTIRVGQCLRCGYVGYIERPSKDWMMRFYARTWDAHIAKGIEEVRNQPPLLQERKTSRIKSVGLIHQLNVDRRKTVCEIGCGYGSVLKYFKDEGFGRVIGIENSDHRAKVVQEAYGIPVLSGNFESDQVQKQLQAYAPIGLFFSHHVLEHTYNPFEILQRISALQDEGDHLILALPNVKGEHAGYLVFYLPHLHSFTKESLERLLNRVGYELVMDNSPDDGNIVIAARKVANPKSKLLLRSDYRAVTLAKIRKGLGLDQLTGNGLFQYHWLLGKEFDDALMSRKLPSVALEKARWYALKAVLATKAALKRYTSRHIFLVEPFDEPKTMFPIEIQYPEDIIFLTK